MTNSNPSASAPCPLVLCGAPLSISAVHSVSVGRSQPELTSDTAVLCRMRTASEIVRRAVHEGQRVYGVTTGFGGMADVAVPAELAAASQNNLLAFLASGAGPPIESRHVRAAMVLRANMLLRGLSGVRIEIVERLIQFLAADAVPLVRQLGSIGASGDLVPLATIARAITGQSGGSRIRWREQDVDGRKVLARLGLKPLELLPKEALSIVNGTSFSAGIAANCAHEARNQLALTLGSHALMIRALCGHDEPLSAFVHQAKPHPGQAWTAQLMRRLLAESAANGKPKSAHLQDRYSLRCLPQYMGPIAEGIARVSHVVHVEMNAVTDNPLIDVEQDRFYQSGNFLGQYVGMAMDDLRRYIGLMAKHLDVQIAQLVTPQFSHGLPDSLAGNTDLPYNMGLKGLQITGNSIMPLLTYHGNPLVEHFPTHAEQYNQNINGLSWGSANLAWQSIQLFQHYLSLALIFAVQAVDLRTAAQHGHYDGRALLNELAAPLYSATYEVLGACPGEARPLVFNDNDQSFETQLDSIHADIANEGTLLVSVAPLLEAFDQAQLGC